MKRARYALLIVTLLLTGAMPLSAAEQTLDLVAKHPGSWLEAPENGLARISFHPENGTFRFTASCLMADQHYALVQHSDDNTRQGYIISLITASTDGRATATGNWSLWKGKIWLVLRDDVEGVAGDLRPDRLTGWHPRHYLFETRQL